MQAEKKQSKKPKKEREKLGVVLRNNWLMLKKIAKMTPEYLLFTALMSIVWGLGNAGYTYFSYLVFNEFDAPAPSFGRVAFFLTLMIVWQFIQNGSSAWYYEYYQGIIDKKLQHKMHSELFEQALAMDLACYDDPKFYNDYVFAMDESKNRAIQVMNDVGTVFRQLITLSALVTILSQVSLTVAILIGSSCVVSVVLMNVTNRMAFRKNERTKPFHRKNSYINRIYHLADHSKELRIGQVDENLQTIYTESVEGIVEEEVKLGKKVIWLDLLGSLATYTAQFAPVLILLAGLYDGSVKLGGYVASLSLMWELRWSLYDTLRTFIRFPEHARYIGKYIHFMNYKPKIVSGSIAAGPFASLELRDLHFAYPTRENAPAEEAGGDAADGNAVPVPDSLCGLNLTIRRGEKVAIVGYNGAGKTTLTKLFMRLYDPTAGQILYNGRPLADYDIPSLRARMGAVFQDYRIFAATVGENVMGGAMTDEDRPAALDALEKSTFTPRLAKMERGLDTDLTREFSDSGENLSGGEAQKVAIARIFARPYDLLIMDEPSSALDPEAEYRLNHTLLSYAADKTVIFISHRLSTTRMADRILMFEGGRLIEEGSHDELMQLGGKYAEMFALQAEKYNGV